MEWIPALTDWPGPLYLRIVEAIAADIANGRLARGQRLPAQRVLADALAIDLTTVTRAYGEARRRGLTEAKVGQGTFVSETTMRSPGTIRDHVKIDLSMNLPPHPVEANLDVRIAKGLAALQNDSSLTAFLNYQPSGGSDEQRAVAATWLRRRVPGATHDRVIIYPGTQAAIFNTLLSLTSPGDVVVTERLTYPGFMAAAARLGVKLVGVAMDEGGILPDALKQACQKHRPKAVYLVPTLQNPTTATLDPDRRAAIADIIRETGTVLIEDDVYGLLEPSASPIANLIPECSYLAVSLSKCITPGLRVSLLLVPGPAAEKAMRSALQAATQMAAPLMVALVTHWLSSGIGDQIISAIRTEANGRQRLAGRIFQGLPFAARPDGHHLWLSLPTWWESSDFVAHVLRGGLAVVGGDAFMVEQQLPSQAVRVSLGAARNRAELAQALQFIAATLKSGAPTSLAV